MRPRHFTRRPAQSNEYRGFTLVELLIYVSVASVVLAAAAATVLSSIRSSTNLEVERRGVETLSRLTQFIETEISQGVEIRTDRGYTDCFDGLDKPRAADPNPGSASRVVFSIATAAHPDTKWQSSNLTVYDRNNNLLWVHYAIRLENGFSNLIRCGPPFDEITGDLKGDAPKAYETRLHPRVQMSIDPDPLKTNEHRVTYTLNFLTPPAANGGVKPIFTSPRRATATTGQQLID